MASERQLSDVLSEFARTMLTTFPIERILDRLVERVVDIMPVSAAGVTLLSPGVAPRYVAASSDAGLRFEALQTELGEGPCVTSYHTGQAVFVPDLTTDDRFPEFSGRALDAGVAAVFSFPLRHDDQPLGALDLYRDAPGALSPRAMTTAQTLADVASAYLLNAQARAELQDASDRSREAALHDPLTGLPNRVLMLERLEHSFLRGRRSGVAPAVLFVDLDRFKSVNDTHGHRVGDELLIAVAERLTGVLRPGDTLARLSGDEFVILCEDLASPGDAQGIVERVDEALALPFELAGAEVFITASVGVAFADRSHTSSEQLLHDADKAMYRAKRAYGEGNGITEHVHDHAGSSVGLAGDLLDILARSELRIDYQPIVSTADGHVTGVEALLRWAHPTRGVVGPGVLVPVAEQCGLIGGIGQWVLDQAWAEQDRWPPERRGEIAIAVNVSARQFMATGFVDMVAAVIASGRSDPGLLTLEVTESVFVRDGERALRVLHALKDLGVMLALDDFGTGYSSLSYLKRFPVDIVKIDRTFVSDLGRDPASRTIVAAVVQLAHGLGMTATAEGVETEAEHQEVSALGCHCSQGFYFARPMSGTRLTELLSASGDGAAIYLPLSRSATSPPR